MASSFTDEPPRVDYPEVDDDLEHMLDVFEAANHGQYCLYSISI